MATKVCSKCKIEKDVSEFYKDRRAKDGFTYLCKSCKSEYDKKWMSENIDKFMETRSRWIRKDSNKEKVREYMKQYRDKNRDKIRAYNRVLANETKPIRLDNTMDAYFAYLDTLEE